MGAVAVADGGKVFFQWEEGEEDKFTNGMEWTKRKLVVRLRFDFGDR